MDFDSSSKFISSLAKFLQSLCNGYVEFDNGVEVIGHIYLNVDTGKKIDYVLNEKVCKTNENSVTFISNSFHAQPAEKPKPVTPVKQKPPSPPEPPQDDGEIILMDDTESNYKGQFSDPLSNRDQYSSSPSPQTSRLQGALKRPHGQSFSSRRASVKAARYNTPTSSNPNGISPPTNNSAFNLSNISAPTESELSHLSKVFPENTDSSSSHEKDIKPVLDKDMNIVNIKEECDPVGETHGGGESYEDQQLDASYYSQDQSYESNEDYYQDGTHNVMQKSDYDQNIYGESGTSGTIGESQGQQQQSGSLRVGCPVVGCNVKYCYDRTTLRNHWLEKHEEYIGRVFCKLCTVDVSFTRRSNLMSHVRKKHGGNFTVGAALGRTEYRYNDKFVNPAPWTFEEALKCIKI